VSPEVPSPWPHQLSPGFLAGRGISALRQRRRWRPETLRGSALAIEHPRGSQPVGHGIQGIPQGSPGAANGRRAFNLRKPRAGHAATACRRFTIGIAAGGTKTGQGGGGADTETVGPRPPSGGARRAQCTYSSKQAPVPRFKVAAELVEQGRQATAETSPPSGTRTKVEALLSAGGIMREVMAATSSWARPASPPPVRAGLP